MFRLPGPDPGRGGVGSSLPKAKVAYSAIWGRGQLSPLDQVAGSKGVTSQQCQLCRACWTSSLSDGSCKSSGGEDPPSAVTGLFCICSVRKRGVLLWLYRRAKSRGCFMACGSRRGEAGVPDAAYSKAWQRRRALLQRRAGLRERAEVIFLLRAGGSGEEI